MIGKGGFISGGRGFDQTLQKQGGFVPGGFVPGDLILRSKASYISIDSVLMMHCLIGKICMEWHVFFAHNKEPQQKKKKKKKNEKEKNVFLIYLGDFLKQSTAAKN